MYANMTPCERIGIAGGCGIDCEIFKDGECPSEDILSTMEEEFNLKAIINTPEELLHDDDHDILQLYKHYLHQEKQRQLYEIKRKQIILRNYIDVSTSDLYDYYKDKSNFIQSFVYVKLIDWLVILEEDEVLSNELIDSISRKLSAGEKQVLQTVTKFIMNDFDIGDVEQFANIVRPDTINNYKLQLSNGFLKANIDIDRFMKLGGINLKPLVDTVEESTDFNLSAWPGFEVLSLIVQHRNFKDYKIKTLFYSRTNDSKFLSKEITDIFIF